MTKKPRASAGITPVCQTSLHRFCVSAELHQAEPEPESYTAWIVEQKKRSVLLQLCEASLRFQTFFEQLWWVSNVCLAVAFKRLLFKVSRSQVQMQLCQAGLSLTEHSQK